MNQKLSVEKLRTVLAAVNAGCDIEARLAQDPVGIVRRYSRRDEQEMVGLLASSLAFGNVKTLRASIERALEAIGGDIVEAARDPAYLRSRLEGFRHRMVQGQELAQLMWGASQVSRVYGSLGESFAERLKKRSNFRDALIEWTSELRAYGKIGDGASANRRGPAQILPDPSKDSSCKRLLLYLRWMVRRDDGVDMGVWPQVSPSVLMIPVDTHIHRIGLNLGMTERQSPSYRVSEEITAVLRRIDSRDPVRFDFALCHLGMAGACRSERGESCEGCGLRGVCRYW